MACFSPVRTCSCPCLSLVTIIVLIAVRFKTASPLSPATLSTCSAFQSIGVGSLRNVFVASRISSFRGCLSFLSPKTLFPWQPQEEPADFDAFGKTLLSVQLLVRSAIVARNRSCGEGGNDGSDRNEVSRLCESTDQWANSFPPWTNQSNGALQLEMGKWTHACNSSSLTTHLVFVALLNKIDEAETRIGTCIRQLASLINKAKKLTETSCMVLQTFRNESNGCSSCEGTSEERQCLPSLKWEAFEKFSARFAFDLCRALFLADTFITIKKLDGIDKQLREYFSLEKLAKSTRVEELTIFQQAQVVVCASVFPQERSISLCERHCHRLRNVLNGVARFVDCRKSPMISFLHRQANTLCGSSKENPCLGFHDNMTSYLDASLSPSRDPFCLNIGCHFPWRNTTNSHHWLQSGQTRLRNLVNNVSALFPLAAFPFDGRLLPCGFDCASVVYTPDEDRIARVVRAVVGVIGVTASFLAIVAFFLNRHRLRHAARRLNVYMNILYIIGPGTDQLFAAVPSADQKFACYSDGTIRHSEPTSTEGASSCVFFSFKFMICAFGMFFLSVGLAHEWCAMLSTLGKLTQWNKFAKLEKRREIVCVVVSLVLSSVLSALPLVRQKVVGSVTRGSCLVDSAEVFFVLTIPFLVVDFILIIYASIGLPMLFKIYHRVKTGPNLSQPSTSRSPNATQRRKSSTQSKQLKALVKILTAYVFTMLVSLFTMAFIFIYIYVQERSLEAETERHILCRMSRCHSEKCPPLPKLNIALSIVPEIYLGLFAVILSLWAFDWNAYWKEHLTCNKQRHSPLAHSSPTEKQTRRTTEASVVPLSQFDVKQQESEC